MDKNKTLTFPLLAALSLASPLSAAEPFAEQTSPSVQPKVLNGETAALLAERLLPWQAAILSLDLGDGTVVAGCGAVVISEYWAVTAAHCVMPHAFLDDILVAGVDTIPAGQANTVNSNYQFTIVQKIEHPDYQDSLFTEGGLDHDIALIRVNRSMSDVATPIQIATLTEQTQADSSFNNTWSATAYSTGDLIASGWGKVAPDFIQPDELQVVKLGGIPDDQCDSGYVTTANSHFVCADSNNPEIKKDVCAGDSGGPLIWQNPDRISDSDFGLRVVGVTSNGPACQEKYQGLESGQSNGLYTELSQYRDWIEQETGLTLSDLPTPNFQHDPFTLVKEDEVVAKSNTSGSSGGLVPTLSLTMMSLVAWWRRKTQAR
ncbi:S1 family peptidase [Photobacterium atrarenae]|uniref:Serine protease n=1 Tax=Photobacterium atrarenae TaxID=865757 RepID=A0ABY5GLS2_9GAMM|nr:serine protease [Photobacterium atrarenae]UTV30091.1 serine protease [Photobacterium atrarenae]